MSSCVLRYIRRLALVFWLGEMLFFIVIFAPRVFRILERPEAAKLQAAIFPAYYFSGFICGIIILVTSSFIWLASQDLKVVQKKRILGLLALALFSTAIFAYSYWSLTPQIAELQPLILAEVVDPAARESFDSLHRWSVQVNGAALIALLILLALL